MIGAGYWGRNIVRAIRSSGIGFVEGVYDMIYDRSLELANTYGIRAYRDLEELLREKNIDGIIVAVPADQLYSVALRVIESKKHVFVEKPVAMKLDEVRDLKIKSERHGVIVVPGFISRYDPVVRELRNIISERGTPVYINIQRSGRRAERYRNISIVLDLGIHDIDILLFLLGEEEIDVIKAEIVKIAGDEAYTACLRYSRGFAILHSDSIPLMKIRKILINFDEERLLEGDLILSEIREVYRDRRTRVLNFQSFEEPLVAELKSFIKKINGEETDSPTLVDAERAHMIIDKILKVSEKYDRGEQNI